MEQRGLSERTQRLRRVPQQSRSRDRVERILDTAATHVVTEGVETLGTRTIAEAAGVPVASLYQYFADKDDILLALVERDLESLDTLVRKNVVIPDGCLVGVDHDEDRRRGFTVSSGGVTVIGKGQRLT